MANQRPDAAELAATIATLEQTNGELAEQLHDVQVSLAARDATIAQMTTAAEQSALDLEATRRHAADLNDDLRRMSERPSSAPLSLDLAALVDLARLVPDEPRYLAGARRLGDQLAAQILGHD